MIHASTNGFDGLIARIEALEKSNHSLSRKVRRLRTAGMGVAALMAVLFLTGAVTIPQSLEAKHFVLRDDSGKMRATLGLRADGTPGLAFYEKDGRARLSLDLGPNGPAVNLMDGTGKPQAALATRSDGTPGLGFFDHDGQIRVSLDLYNGGLPAMNLFSDDGSLSAAFAVRPDGSPGLGMFTPEGKVGASFELPANIAAQRRQGYNGPH